MSDRRRSLRAPVLLVWFVVLWVGLWGTLTWANLLGGIAVAIGVVSVTRLPTVGWATYTGARIRPLPTLSYGVFLLVKIVQANVQLAWEVVTPKNTIAQGIIGVSLRDCSDALVTLIANSYTLTPGSLTIEVVRVGDESTIYLHVLHLADRDEVRLGLIEVAARAVRAFGTTQAREQFARGGPLDLEAARAAVRGRGRRDDEVAR